VVDAVAVAAADAVPVRDNMSTMTQLFYFIFFAVVIVVVRVEVGNLLAFNNRSHGWKRKNVMPVVTAMGCASEPLVDKFKQSTRQ